MILNAAQIRQLIADLGRARFINRGGKGSHRNYEHPIGLRVLLSGNSGDDAWHYQEREVRRALADLNK
jgi:predicted RNA binding protein YcfA (HicA-like mRNA interferase family)